MPMPAPPKVLSRLEVLRQQREAARGGKPSEGEKPAEGEKKP
jgi:hypothetical protein